MKPSLGDILQTMIEEIEAARKAVRVALKEAKTRGVKITVSVKGLVDIPIAEIDERQKPGGRLTEEQRQSDGTRAA